MAKPLGAMSPMMFSMLRARMQSGQGVASPSVSAPGVINLNIDLSALKDLWGRRKITDAEDDAEPSPAKVQVTNMPRISPS